MYKTFLLSIVRVKVLYLAMVLPFVLQRLLQVQAAGQVALSQVVAELRNTEQLRLYAHCFTVCKQENAHTNKHGKRVNKSTFVNNTIMYLKCFTLYLNACRIPCLRNDSGGKEKQQTKLD